MIQFIKNFGWNALSQVYKIIFSSLVLILLARLIEVKDFGIIGMSMVFILFFNTILSIGFDISIIQKENFRNSHLYSLFIVTLMAGILIMVMANLISPAVSLFYGNKEIGFVFASLTPNILLASVGIVPKGFLHRTFNFKKLAIVDIVSITISGVFAIILALKDYGYWALISQQLIFTGLCSLGYLILASKDVFKVKVISLKVIKGHLNFGLNVLVFNVTNFFAQQMDILLIGKLLGEVELGFYTLAFNLIIKPIGLLIQVFNKTIFPYFSRIKGYILEKEYFKSTNIFLTVFGSLIVFGITLAYALIPIILTEKWSMILPLIIVFGFQGSRALVASPSGLLFLLSGRPDKQWQFSILISLPLRFIGLFLGYNFISKDSLGILIGFNILATIEMLIGFVVTFNLIGFNLKLYLKQVTLTFTVLLLLALIFSIISNLIAILWLSILMQTMAFLIIFYFMIKSNDEISSVLKKMEI